MSEKPDIVERLRYHVEIRGGPAKDDSGNFVGTTWPMMIEAADEIERLRADHTDKASAWDAIAEKNAELSRLRSSHDSLVKALRDVRMVHHIGPDTYFGVVGESGCWSVKLPPEAVQIFDEWFTRTRTLLASIGDKA